LSPIAVSLREQVGKHRRLSPIAVSLREQVCKHRRLSPIAVSLREQVCKHRRLSPIAVSLRAREVAAATDEYIPEERECLKTCHSQRKQSVSDNLLVKLWECVVGFLTHKQSFSLST
ncbi:hypothetical protein GBAR_LOCUS28423, partial [Geodia barretti]